MSKKPAAKPKAAARKGATSASRSKTAASKTKPSARAPVAAASVKMPKPPKMPKAAKALKMPKQPEIPEHPEIPEQQELPEHHEMSDADLDAAAAVTAAEQAAHDAAAAVENASAIFEAAMPDFATEASGSQQQPTNHSDVAIASLCQSYAHALSLAFHETVIAQQRRAALGQAALAQAIQQIQSVEPKDFEDRLQQLRKGLDVIGLAGSNDMEMFTDLSRQFQAAANQLLEIRERTANLK